MTKFHWVRRTELDVEEQRKVQARRLQRQRPVSALRLFMSRVAKFFNRVIDAFAYLAERVGAVIQAVLPRMEPVVRTGLQERFAGDIEALIEKRQTLVLPQLGVLNGSN